MSEGFDAYYKWLGIPPRERPIHYYRLLGLEPFEDDPAVVEAAADRQMAHVRSFQAGRHSAASQKLLNELSAARVCLLDPQKKAAYDRQLRAAMNKPAAESESTAPPRLPATSAAASGTEPAGTAAEPAARRLPAAVVAVGLLALAVGLLAGSATIYWLSSPGGGPQLAGAEGSDELPDGGPPAAVATAAAEAPPADAPPEAAAPPATVEQTTAAADKPTGAETASETGEAAAGEPASPAVVKVEEVLVPPADPSQTRGRDSGDLADMLRLIDTERDAVVGQWRFDDGALVGSMVSGGQMLEAGRLQVPQVPQPEYRLELDVERVSAAGSLVLGLLYQGKPMAVLLDRNGRVIIRTERGYAVLGGACELPVGKVVSLTVEVAVDDWQMSADGQKIARGSTARSEPALPPSWFVLQPGYLFLGVDGAEFRFSRVRLSPLPPGGMGDKPRTPALAPVVREMPTIDLLRLVEASRDRQSGHWLQEGGSLTGEAPADAAPAVAALLVPYRMPPSYRLEMVVERVAGQGHLLVGTFPLTLWALDRSGRAALFTDERRVLVYPKELRLEVGKQVTLVFQRSGGHGVLTVDGQPLVRWTPAERLLTLPLMQWTDRSRLLLGCDGATFRWHRLTLTPLDERYPGEVLVAGVLPADLKVEPPAAADGPQAGAVGDGAAGATTGPAQAAPARLPPKERLPLPDEATAAAAVEKIREQYRVELTRSRTAAQRSALARSLADAAEAFAGPPAEQYAHFELAHSAAMDGRDLDALLRVLERWELWFEIDRRALEKADIDAIVAATRPPAEREQLARTALDRIPAAVKAEQFELAVNLQQAAQSILRNVKNPGLAEVLQARTAELRVWPEQARAAQAAAAKLATEPDDAEAHLARGRYLCLVQGDWESGLANLAKGSDAVVKAAAEKEIRGGRSPADLLALADQWYLAAQRSKLPDKLLYMERAWEWYLEAWAVAPPEEDRRLQIRLAEIERFRRNAGMAFGRCHPADAVAFGGHWYKVLGDKPCRWTEAYERCREAGGYPVCVETPQENEFLAQLIRTSPGTIHRVWLGANDLKESRVFRWINGSPAGFAAWAAGQPDGAGGDQHYLSAVVDTRTGRLQWCDLVDDHGLDSWAATMDPRDFITFGRSRFYVYCICEWDR